MSREEIDIAGNRYRLAAYVSYRTGCVYVRHVMTHTEYSRRVWT